MNYGKFYALYNLLPLRGEGVKEELVFSHTGGRTTSLKEMSDREYYSLIKTLEQAVGRVDQLRSERSGTLKLMTRLGIDTSDWSVVDAFCEHPRIIGKPFRKITVEEHIELQRKLRAIIRKSKGSNGSKVLNDNKVLVIDLSIAGTIN